MVGLCGDGWVFSLGVVAGFAWCRGWVCLVLVVAKFSYGGLIFFNCFL